jgi:hypothetical protein
VPISLVIAFRQQFPEGSLLSEVLTIHDGLFVVRVSVAVEGQVLSQALGSNNSLELAEDIACNRALERLALTLQATASLPGNDFLNPLRRLKTHHPGQNMPRLGLNQPLKNHPLPPME